MTIGPLPSAFTILYMYCTGAGMLNALLTHLAVPIIYVLSEFIRKIDWLYQDRAHAESLSDPKC